MHNHKQWKPPSSTTNSAATLNEVIVWGGLWGWRWGWEGGSWAVVVVLVALLTSLNHVRSSFINSVYNMNVIVSMWNWHCELLALPKFFFSARLNSINIPKKENTRTMVFLNKHRERGNGILLHIMKKSSNWIELK